MIENAEPCREGQKQSEEVDGIHAFTAGCSCPLRQEKPAMVRFPEAQTAPLMTEMRAEADPCVDKNAIAFCNLIKGFFRINKEDSHN